MRSRSPLHRIRRPRSLLLQSRRPRGLSTRCRTTLTVSLEWTTVLGLLGLFKYRAKRDSVYLLIGERVLSHNSLIGDMVAERREVSSLAVKHAPDEYRLKWSQKGLQNTLNEWEETRPEDFKKITTTHDVGMLVGWTIRPDSLGQYNYDANFDFIPEVEDHLLDSEKFSELLHEFTEDWIKNIVDVVYEAAEESLFSPKELVVKLMDENETIQEKKIADALGVSVGTIRGKKGRVQSKINKAEKTLALVRSFEESDEEAPREYHYDIIQVYEADELPVYGVREDYTRFLQALINEVSDESENGAKLSQIVREAQRKYDWSKERVLYELDNLEDKNLIEWKDEDVVRLTK